MDTLLKNRYTYREEQGNVLGRSQFRALLLVRVLQHHSGQDLSHLLQSDVVSVSEGREGVIII